MVKGLVMELLTRGGESKDETEEGEAQSSEMDRLRLWAIFYNCVDVFLKVPGWNMRYGCADVINK